MAAERVELSPQLLMRLNNEDLERCYQLVMKKISEYDLCMIRSSQLGLRNKKEDPEYRRYLSSQSNLILHELVRRRWLIR